MSAAYNVSDNTILSARQTAFNALRDQIVQGELRPGTRLVHRNVAKQMGMSTIPVIEAMRQLEAMGLLVTTAGVGTEVKTWQPHDYEEAYLIRAAHEGIACRLFAQRASETDIVLLNAYNEAFQNATEAFRSAMNPNLIEGVNSADIRFHTHIVQGAKSSELSRLFENSGIILLVIGKTLLREEAKSMMNREPDPPGLHDEIVRFLRERDGAAAEQAMREHIMRAFEITQRAIMESQADSPIECGETISRLN